MLTLASVASSARADTLTLDSCLALAVRHNPEVRAADREADAARARHRQALALEALTCVPSLPNS